MLRELMRRDGVPIQSAETDILSLKCNHSLASRCCNNWMIIWYTIHVSEKKIWSKELHLTERHLFRSENCFSIWWEVVPKELIPVQIAKRILILCKNVVIIFVNFAKSSRSNAICVISIWPGLSLRSILAIKKCLSSEILCITSRPKM